MCVPYSFIITAKGEILDGKNLDHHTDICAKHGVGYDSVLKPEYQIWNREIHDLDSPVTLVADQLPFYRPDGFVRNKYIEMAEKHVEKKFPDWKAGLNYFEENWNIVKKYIPKLVTSTKGLEGLEGREEVFYNHLRDYMWFRHWVTIVSRPAVKDMMNNYFKEYAEYRLEFRPVDWTDERLVKVFTVNFHDLMRSSLVRWHDKHELAEPVCMPDIYDNKMEEIVEHHINQFHYEAIKAFEHGDFKLSGSGTLTFESFMKHWSKKQNRVECWK